MVKYENIQSAITPLDNDTYEVASWTISRTRLGSLRTISLHKNHSEDSYVLGEIVGYKFDNNKTTVIYKQIDGSVAAGDLNWGGRQCLTYL